MLRIRPTAGREAARALSVDGSAQRLPPGIHSLDGTDQTMPDDDLRLLSEMVGETANVGIGESIHTSEGFEAMKARMVRFLIEDAGFRVVAIESPRTAVATTTNPYVQTCQGSPTDAAGGIFPVFASDAMGELLGWMCRWNAEHPHDRVQFIGFDAQQPWTDWDALRTYLTVAAPADAAALTAGITLCDGPQASSEDDYWQNHSYDPYPVANFQACNGGIDAIDAYFASHAQEIAHRTSREAFELGKLSSVSFRSWQGEQYYGEQYDALGDLPDLVGSLEARDLAMGKIYETLRALYFPLRKAALWAHNYHLMKSHVTADDPNGIPGARNMGGVLSQDLGREYAPIGQSGWDVEINWPGVGYGPTSYPQSDAEIEWNLHAFGRPWLLVDLEDPRLASFLAPGEEYTWGNPGQMGMVPADQFRALVYFEASPPMNALFWGTPDDGGVW